jgi:hypothetical protein
LHLCTVPSFIKIAQVVQDLQIVLEFLPHSCQVSYFAKKISKKPCKKMLSLIEKKIRQHHPHIRPYTQKKTEGAAIKKIVCYL